MRKEELKIQKYMSEIAGDAFFWVYFAKLSFRSTITHLIIIGAVTPPILTPALLENVK